MQYLIMLMARNRSDNMIRPIREYIEAHDDSFAVKKYEEFKQKIVAEGEWTRFDFCSLERVNEPTTMRIA